jgi:hypothetical protein
LPLALPLVHLPPFRRLYLPRGAATEVGWEGLGCGCVSPAMEKWWDKAGEAWGAVKPLFRRLRKGAGGCAT